MERITELNIQPQAGVLGVFSRLNYKPWYAIAEFVDNSTQSFYNLEIQHGVKISILLLNMMEASIMSKVLLGFWQTGVLVELDSHCLEEGEW